MVHHRVACFFFKARKGYALFFRYLQMVRCPTIFFTEFLAKALNDFRIIFRDFRG